MRPVRTDRTVVPGRLHNDPRVSVSQFLMRCWALTVSEYLGAMTGQNSIRSNSECCDVWP